MRELSKIERDDKKLELSIKDFDQAYKLNENLDYVYGKMVHAKMLLSSWNNFDEHLTIIERGLENLSLIHI